MGRFHLSIVIAAFTAAVLLQIVLMWRDNPAVSGVDFNSTVFYGLFSYFAILLFGLPWMPFLRRRAMTGLWSTTAVAAVAASIPYLGFCAYLLVAEVYSGRSVATIVSDNLGVFTDYMSFFLFMGVVCGLVIWLLGIRGNPHGPMANVRQEPESRCTTAPRKPA